MPEAAINAKLIHAFFFHGSACEDLNVGCYGNVYLFRRALYVL